MNTKHRNTRRDLVACIRLTYKTDPVTEQEAREQRQKKTNNETSHKSADVIIHQQPWEYFTVKMHESFTHLHVISNLLRLFRPLNTQREILENVLVALFHAITMNRDVF